MEGAAFLLTVVAGVVRSSHEQSLSRLPSGSAASSAALVAGLVAGGPLSAVRGGGRGDAEPVGDLCEVRGGRRAGAGSLRSAHDGAASDLRVLPGGGEFTTHRAGDLRGCGVPLPGGGRASRSRYDRGLSQRALDGACATLRAGVAVVPARRAGEAGACGAGRDEGESE